MDSPGGKSHETFFNIMNFLWVQNYKVYCQSCDPDRPRFPAHSYCTNCFKHLCEKCCTVHRKQELSRHHTLFDKASMSQAMLSLTTSQSDHLTKQCPKHNIEMIKFYCHGHKALLCRVCITLEHTRTSCKVNYIPDISGQVINSNECQDILKSINDMAMEANKTLQSIKQMNDNSNSSLSKALKDMKAFRTEINQWLDELEKQIEEAAKVIQKENATQLTRVEKECEDLLKSLNISSDAITQFNTSNQANDLFVEVKQTDQKIKEYEQSIARLTALDVKIYNFEPNEAISNLLSVEESMGTLNDRSITHLMPRKVTKEDKICINNGRCFTTGMTLLTPNLILITDCMDVKIIDISTMSVLDEHKLYRYTWDLASVLRDKIAVTIPDEHTIQFMSVSRNKLRKKNTVKVDGRCRGISCNKDKMVVTFTIPAKVQILLINGTVLQTIQNENIFSWPDYVTTSLYYIYVSDNNKRRIIKLNWQGEVKGTYVCRSRPDGLTMSGDETVFVYFHDDNTIKEILEDFTTEQSVVENKQGPLAVCWSSEACTLYLTSYTLSPEEDKFIKIYKLPQYCKTIFTDKKSRQK